MLRKAHQPRNGLNYRSLTHRKSIVRISSVQRGSSVRDIAVDNPPHIVVEAALVITPVVKKRAKSSKLNTHEAPTSTHIFS